MVRAMTPVFTVMISIIFLQKQYPRKIYISLLPVKYIFWAQCDTEILTVYFLI